MKANKKVTIQFGKRLWNKLNKIAKEQYGEFGFATLSEEEQKEVILNGGMPKIKK